MTISSSLMFASVLIFFFFLDFLKCVRIWSFSVLVFYFIWSFFPGPRTSYNCIYFIVTSFTLFICNCVFHFTSIVSPLFQAFITLLYLIIFTISFHLSFTYYPHNELYFHDSFIFFSKASYLSHYCVYFILTSFIQFTYKFIFGFRWSVFTLPKTLNTFDCILFFHLSLSLLITKHLFFIGVFSHFRVFTILNAIIFLLLIFSKISHSLLNVHYP